MQGSGSSPRLLSGAMALALAAALLLASGPTSIVGAKAVKSIRPAAGPTLTIAIDHDVETLDSDFSHYPLANEVNYNTQAQYFIYGIQSASHGYQQENVAQIKPKSIASWKMAKNGLSVVLNIQKGNRFCHTGNPVTANDYVYYFNRGIHTKSGYLFNIAGAFVKGWKKLSTYSFKLTFSRPSPFFFYLFRDQSQAPVDMRAMQKHATKSDPWATAWKAKHDAGSGPYCVSRWLPGTEMDLSANPYYKGPGKPHFKQVVLKIVPNSSERALLLKTGTVQVADGLTRQEINSVRGSSGVKVLDIQSRDQYEVGLNSKISPFNKRGVRQALSWAVPYQSIMKNLFGGHALLPQGAVPVRGQLFDPKTWPYKYNLSKAKSLLAKASYPHGFKFRLDITAGDAISQDLAVVLQSTLSKIGVQMSINTQTPAIFAQGLNTKSHQAWLEDVLWYVNDPAYVGNSFYRCGALLNWTNYCNKTVDNTITALLNYWRPADHAKKKAAASKMQRLINADAPTLILAEPDLEVAMRSNISGYVAAPDEEMLYNYLK
jgi:peptide/nickel transport system substrate-binding protein